MYSVSVTGDSLSHISSSFAKVIHSIAHIISKPSDIMFANLTNGYVIYGQTNGLQILWQSQDVKHKYSDSVSKSLKKTVLTNILTDEQFAKRLSKYFTFSCNVSWINSLCEFHNKTDCSNFRKPNFKLSINHIQKVSLPSGRKHHRASVKVTCSFSYREINSFLDIKETVCHMIDFEL